MDNNYDSDYSDSENISSDKNYYDSDVEDLYVSNTKCNISKNVDENINLNKKYIKGGEGGNIKNKYKFVITMILGICMLLVLLYIYKIYNY